MSIPASPVPAISVVPPKALLDGHLFGRGQPCFGCSPDHPTGFRLAFEKHDHAERGEEIVTRFTAGQGHQGPPGIMHGGLVSTLADETAAWAIIGLLGKFGFTVGFDAKLRRAIRIDVPMIARSWVKEDRRRIVEVGLEIEQDGERACTGNFKFALLNKAAAERMLGRAMPPEWESFCR